MTRLRAHIHVEKKILLHWPIAIGYLETVRHLAAWCELRKDFRSFRIDPIIQATFLDERYLERCTALRVKWMKDMHLSRMRERWYHDRDGQPLPKLRRLLRLFTQLAALYH